MVPGPDEPGLPTLGFESLLLEVSSRLEGLSSMGSINNVSVLNTDGNSWPLSNSSSKILI